MRRYVLWLFARPAAAAVTLTVCQGGACSRNGGRLLLDAALAFAGNDDLVAGASCCSTCPNSGVIVRDAADGGFSKPSASYPAQAIDAAAALIVQAGGAAPPPALVAGFADHLSGLEEIRTGGDARLAVELLTRAIEAAPASLPVQPPLEPAPLEWEASEWEEALFGTSLSFDESITTFEFGSCADGVATLSECEALGEEAPTLTGSIELSDDLDAVAAGYGELRLVMADDGRSFDGTVVDEGGQEHAWRGRRIVAAGEAGEEPPPARSRWLHESLLGRARARLELGEHAGAADDARAATALCCRVAAGWQLLAEAAAASGDTDAAEAAKREHEWLAD